eukprot:2771266-Rhodomonas_salina.1
MQTLRENSRDPLSNIPTSARQAEYVDPGVSTARRGRAQARMDGWYVETDGPSPTGSEPDNR